ncbi:MAG: glycoside hydrolase family 172 protein [Kaistella sp.]
MKLIAVILCVISVTSYSQQLYIMPEGQQTGWSSFENPGGLKGQGGKENNGAKGHPMEMLRPKERKVLLNIQGAGVIQRIWLTLNERSPRILRAIRLDMYWDGETKPAVSTPLSDFFGIGLGRTIPFQNTFFSNPEGRSFNCYIPMPFRKGARITITNESDSTETLFYDINFLRVKEHPAGVMYFHASWNRNSTTKLGEDFEILPKVTGKGRFLGCNLGIIADSIYGKSWWGEGEVKMYVDGDSNLPTLVGTGTEDYIGTAWGQGAFSHQYQGCPIADDPNRQWTFYRYHVPDPVYFTTDIRVVIQQMGGDMTPNVKKIVQGGAKLIPVTVATQNEFLKLFEMNPVPRITDQHFPEGWTNFYRLDNYSATAYFYLDKPVNSLPPLATVGDRTEGTLKK